MVEEIRERLRNGLGTKILATFIGGLLLAATVAGFNVASSLDSISVQISQLSDRMDRQSDRLTYLERKVSGD